jgi:hypothetical protein
LQGKNRLRFSQNISFGKTTLDLGGKSGLQTAFSKAIPKTNRVLGKARLSVDFLGFYARGATNSRSLLRLWIFCIDMQKILDYRAPLCSLQGITIHFCEFLYDFALKRNKLRGAEKAGVRRGCRFCRGADGDIGL